MSFIIAIANEKGGVAKTTSALSLGGALANDGKKILLVDLDPQANLSLSLGVNPPKLQRTIADVLLGNQSLRDVSRQTEIPDLELIPSNQELGMAERFLVVRDRYELILRNALQELNGYDMTLIDCPPALGPLTYVAMAAADLLIVPTQCEFFSAHALRNILALIRTVRQQANPQLRYRILVTMLDRRNRIHRNLLQHIRKAFRHAVFDTVVEIDTRLRESPVFNQPISVYAPSSRGAVQYRELAQELGSYIHEIAGTPSRSA